MSSHQQYPCRDRITAVSPASMSLLISFLSPPRRHNKRNRERLTKILLSDNQKFRFHFLMSYNCSRGPKKKAFYRAIADFRTATLNQKTNLNFRKVLRTFGWMTGYTRCDGGCCHVASHRSIYNSLKNFFNSQFEVFVT